MQRHLTLRLGIAIVAITGVLVAVLIVALGGQAHHAPRSTPAPSAPITSVAPPGTSGGQATATVFNYGFDFSNQAPDAPNTDPAANTAARQVLARFRGSIMDTSIFGFGLPDPEPSPGTFKMSALSQRLSLIEAAGGIPVITLVGAPAWMRADGSAATAGRTRSAARQAGGAGGFFQPPSAAHYQDFADLCAHIAATFPTVRYFVVWNEMKGFYRGGGWDYKGYTAMYNDVYLAIKKVRPDAQVGGPYAVMSGHTSPPNQVTSAVNGGSTWGYLDQGMLETVSYWLQHKVGADFIAVDGATVVAKADNAALADPAAAGQLYEAVDRWIRTQTSLPIWWMESHIQPTHGWTSQQASAARVAVLAEMAASGASVGLQWQPQEQSGWADQGLWTSTLTPEGGQPTPLAGDLLAALPVLRAGGALVGGQPRGVVVTSSPSGSLIVNTLDRESHAVLGGSSIPVGPDQVLVR